MYRCEKVTEEKEKKGQGVTENPAGGEKPAQREIFARMQDFSSKWYTNLRDALVALKSGEAKVLVINLENPTRYVYVTLNYANPNYFFVKEFSEDQVFNGDYSTAELQKMTEEQVYGLLLSGKD
jgi:hypothetical protein